VWRVDWQPIWQLWIVSRNKLSLSTCSKKNNASMLKWKPIGCQSTRHTVDSSHGQLVTGQLVTRSTRHAVDSSQRGQHGVWGAGQLVIRFWAVTSWPCDELTGTRQNCTSCVFDTKIESERCKCAISHGTHLRE